MTTLFTLTANSTNYDDVGRPTNRLKLDRLNRSLDEADTLEFHQYGATLPALLKEGMLVSLGYSGTPVFAGEVMRVDPHFDNTGWTIGYMCGGLKYVGNKIAVTNPNDNTGTITFNLPGDDPDYNITMSGASVGQILAYMFANHATQLTAAGITGGYDATDTSAITLVPNAPVTFNGPAFFNSIDSFLDQWAGIYSCTVVWSGTAWWIRVLNTTTFTPTTLTLGTDPIDPPSISRDSSGSYSAVVVRGRSEIEALFGSVVDGTITPAWTGPQQAAWTWNDFINPSGATDYGTASGVGSTALTVMCNDVTRHWVTNFWSTNLGVIWLINPAATNITQQEMRYVTACGAMTAGGTCSVTLDRPLVNGGYTAYRMICEPPDTLVDVWRTYNVTSTIAFNHLVHKFYPAALWVTNGVCTLISFPAGNILNGVASFPATFVLNSATNQIVFSQPTVTPWNSASALASGGAYVTAPTDVQVALPYSRGTMTARAPSSGYSGTLYSYAGIQRTWYLDYAQWVYAGDLTNYANLAAMKLATVQNTVVTGNVTYYGLYAAALTLGMSLNIAGTGYTTGWESLAAPVRSMTLQWPQDGAVNWVTTLTLNNRRKQATGDSFYVHPAFTGGAAWQGNQQAGFGSAKQGSLNAGGMLGEGGNLNAGGGGGMGGGFDPSTPMGGQGGGTSKPKPKRPAVKPKPQADDPNEFTDNSDDGQVTGSHGAFSTAPKVLPSNTGGAYASRGNESEQYPKGQGAFSTAPNVRPSIGRAGSMLPTLGQSQGDDSEAQNAINPTPTGGRFAGGRPTPQGDAEDPD